MTQLSPSIMLYSQALEVINDVRKRYAAQSYKSPDEIISLINKALVDFENKAGKALTQYEPVMHSEVPDSQKMNRFWETLQADVNILQQQVDLLRAAAVFTHNFTKTEIIRSQDANKRLLSKLKTLEMYTSGNDQSLVYFGDTFISEDFIDTSFTSPSDRAQVLGYGYIGLGVQTATNVVDQQSRVHILPGSNGFAGNNQELVDPLSAPVDPVSNDPIYTFVAETYDSSVINNIIDSQPNSWFEFEKIWIDKDIRDNALNYNFHYLTVSDQDSYFNDPSSFAVDSNGRIEWANGINGSKTGTLHLKLLVDLGSAKPLNKIKFLPYGLADNQNNPIKVSKVLYSADGSIWDVAGPENVWIAHTIDRRLSTIQSEIVNIDEATWVLKDQSKLIRYIRFEIEQPNPIRSQVGHLFYLDKNFEKTVGNIGLVNLTFATDPEDLIYDDDVYYDSPLYDVYILGDVDNQSSNYGETQTDSTNNAATGLPPIPNVNTYRRLGPNPPADKPTKYLDPKNTNVNDLIQKREYFEGLRWCIGIRDIELTSNIYQTNSFFITNQFHVGGIVDRVSLEAEVEVPAEFDQSINWIKFYVSPDNGISWHQISRIQDDFLELPEIIAFNNPIPLELREPGVAYIDTPNAVENLRLKVEFSRPEDLPYLTPILHSYKLKVKRRI